MASTKAHGFLRMVPQTDDELADVVREVAPDFAPAIERLERVIAALRLAAGMEEPDSPPASDEAAP